MKPIVRLLGAFAISLFSGLTAQAGMEEPYVRCVQQQLSALGLSDVAVTGRINSATKAGVDTVRRQFGDATNLAALPRLSTDSAVSWCREIGALKPGLRQMMPSSRPPFVLGQSDMQTVLLQSSFSEVEQFYRSFYGIYPASRVDVAGADSGEILADFALELQRRRGPSIGRMRDYVARICDTPSLRFGGQAYMNQLLICWPYETSYGADWRRDIAGRLSFLMVHEYMHHVQRELANNKVGGPGYGYRTKMGPAWMVEGSASLAEYRWAQQRGGNSAKMLAKAQKYSEDSKKTLNAMLEHGSVKGYEQYQIAMYGVFLLEERFGKASVLNYWRAIGANASWESAFHSAFGLSMGEYMGQFKTMRLDPAKAMAFRAVK